MTNYTSYVVEGKDAFLNGLEETDCKYSIGTPEYENWLVGYRSGWNMRYDRFGEFFRDDE